MALNGDLYYFNCTFISSNCQSIQASKCTTTEHGFLHRRLFYTFFFTRIENLMCKCVQKAIAVPIFFAWLLLVAFESDMTNFFSSFWRLSWFFCATGFVVLHKCIYIRPRSHRDCRSWINGSRAVGLNQVSNGTVFPFIYQIHKSLDTQDWGESSSHGGAHVNVQVNNAVLCINTAHLSSSKGRDGDNESELCYFSCVRDVICEKKVLFATPISP